MRKINNRTIKRIEGGVFLLGLIVISVGIVYTLLFNYTFLSCDEYHFQIQTPKEFEVWDEKVDIDCVLFTPKKEYDIYEKRPAIVYLHGFSSSKIAFRGFADELGKRGFVGLSITSRGHGGSSGQVGFTNENEVLTAVKWLRENAEKYNIDKNRIGLVGHSAGAYSVTLAAIKDYNLGNNWINSTIVLGGPRYNVDNEEATAINLFLTLGDWIYPTIEFDFEEDLENIKIEGKLAENITTVPRNYMYILGEYDNLYTPNAAREIVWNFGKEAVFGTSNYKKVDLNKRYGDFKNGTARKITILPEIDHTNEIFTKLTFEETINWFENSLSLKNDDDYPGKLNPDTITGEKRQYGRDIILVGLVLIILPLSIYLGNWARNEDSDSEILPAEEIESGNILKLFGIYSAIFIGTCSLVVPIILAFGFVDIFVIDFLIFNAIVLMMFIQAIILLPFVLGLMYLEHRKYGETLKDFGLNLNPRLIFKNLLFGIIFFFALYILLVVAFTLNGFISFIVYRLFSFLEVFAYLFIFCLINELFFSGLIQTKLSRYKHDKLLIIPSGRELFYTAIISSLITGLGVGSIVIMFVMDTRLYIANFITLILILILIFFLLSLFNAWLYRKTRNILGPTILISLLLSLVASVLLPSIIA